jgi:hypothetical protein
VLDRTRENRSQFVFTRAKGRDMIFWQSARTSKQARPNVRVPKARASGRSLEIFVDSNERYAWKFNELLQLPSANSVPAAEPTTKEVRAWARSNGLEVPDRGRLRPEVWAAFHQARSAN